MQRICEKRFRDIERIECVSFAYRLKNDPRIGCVSDAYPVSKYAENLGKTQLSQSFARVGCVSFAHGSGATRVSDAYRMRIGLVLRALGGHASENATVRV